ncbi:unnamed protein product [Rangifer tarandus platyrhynchus]|uniref:Uncharacterized protein n=1 Tax=Rangifer tarandus platyrhynchus TaxID=3082113 RepID=A0ABN8XXQ9_RANTA|nr:unnamed protein product [Rangifer tarandus platyrhynchus]
MPPAGWEVDEVPPGSSGGSTDLDPVFQPRETEFWFLTSDLCSNRHAPGHGPRCWKSRVDGFFGPVLLDALTPRSSLPGAADAPGLQHGNPALPDPAWLQVRPAWF